MLVYTSNNLKYFVLKRVLTFKNYFHGNNILKVNKIDNMKYYQAYAILFNISIIHFSNRYANFCPVRS